MTKEQRALLELVQIGTNDNCTFSERLYDSDWKQLGQLIQTQGLSCVCMHGLEIMHKLYVDVAPLEEKLRIYARSQQVQDSTKKKIAKSSAFAGHVRPIQIVALKGVDYAQYWRNPLWREFGDLDCCVANGDGKELDQLAIEKGCRFEEGDMKHTQLFWDNLLIENHHYFTSFAGSEESVLLEKELKRLFQGEFTKIEGTELLSPNANFTAVYMIAHAQKHFFYEGMNLRQILDWYFFLTKEECNVDWKLVEDVLERTKLKTFAVLLTQICKKYFGLQFNPFGSGSSVDEELVSKFLNDIFADKYNDHDRRWWMMIARMWNRFTRMFRFRVLLNLPVHKAIWKTIAYSSFFHRKPTLE